MQKIEQNPNILKLIWFGFLTSTVVLVFMSNMLVQSPIEFSSELLISQVAPAPIFYLIMTVMIIAVINMHKMLAPLKLKPNVDYDPEYEWQYFIKLFVIKLTLSEAITVLAFSLVMVQANPYLIVLPSITSIVLILSQFPKFKITKQEFKI